MTTWCQNIKCADKKNQNQIRGNKGSKYYQSNKANKYYEHWCSESCRKQWFSDHATVCLNAVGEIDRQVVPLEDAWYVEYRYDWRSEIQDRYHLVNKLKGVDHSITREQAQTQEQIDADHSWRTITDAQARELAVSLGLVS